jgi:hypothetical protein
MNIVGLGGPGCAVASRFTKYSEYSVYCVDTKNLGYSGSFVEIQEQKTHEDYENNYVLPKLKINNEPTTFILSGAGKISGACLRILEGLTNKNVIVIYIKSDAELLSQKAKTREKVTFQVLQQYARSAVLEKIYIVDNTMIEKLMEQSLIKNYWDNVNEVIANTYHMINVFNNTEPLLKTSTSFLDVARIATFGFVDPESKKEKLLYDLKCPRSKVYYFGVNSETIESDKNLLHDVRTFVKEKTEENVDVSFSIYSTSYERSYTYSVQEASMIQEEN